MNEKSIQPDQTSHFVVTLPIIAIIYATYKTYRQNIVAAETHAAEQQRVSKALQESEEHFRTAFDHAAGMALVSTDGRWVQVNQSFCDMLGYSEEELLAMTFEEITYPEDLGDELVKIHQLLAGKASTSQLEKRYVHKSGKHVWVLSSASVTRDAENNPLNFIFQTQDITERKRAEEHIHHAAFHDALTGLPNRGLLTDRLSMSVERAKRNKGYFFAVLFIDLDRFKVVNDSLGHPVGDQLLVELSRRLEKCMRTVDTVARLGGDEFAILLDGVEGAESAILVADRIQQDLSLPFNLGGHEVFTTASIGIAFSSSGYDKPEDILRDSDTAMYRAKANGKARYEVFDQAMHTIAVQLLKLENDLRRAVEREEIEVHYQPIISLETEELVGFEALARWRHPTRGLIPPVKFIPLAEETGLIIPLGSQLLRQACGQMRLWQQQFSNSRKLTISVNLSSIQFQQTGLVEHIEQILQETELEPSSLRLEITESIVMENAHLASEMLNRLNALGVRISLDDFGTGYSSLAYLHEFPIQNLKIDRSFVSRIGTSKDSSKIIKTIITLAAELDMNVTAEGVETRTQHQQLRVLGCDFGQGYFFSKPITAVAAEELMRVGSPERVILEGGAFQEKAEVLGSNYSM